MTPRVNLDSLFGAGHVMLILRGCAADKAVELANRAWDLGVELVEVPLGAHDEHEALAAVVEEGDSRGKAVGAGTTLSPEDVAVAASAGAKYTVSPGFDPAVLAASLSAGLPHLPGVATPTEVQRVYRAGCRWVKVFPASTLGPGWVRAVRGPFPELRQVVTGGVTLEAAPEYLTAGAHVVAFGPHALRHSTDLVNLATSPPRSL